MIPSWRCHWWRDQRKGGKCKLPYKPCGTFSQLPTPSKWYLVHHPIPNQLCITFLFSKLWSLLLKSQKNHLLHNERWVWEKEKTAVVCVAGVTPRFSHSKWKRETAISLILTLSIKKKEIPNSNMDVFEMDQNN